MLPNFEQKCAQKREQIQEFFFYKQFRTQQQGQPRTAQEIIQIASENLKILGPLLNRFQEELLKPIIIRSYFILLRAGKFPKMSALLREGMIPDKSGMNIVYLSPIAKAQRLYEAQELQNAYGMLVAVAQMKPEVLDNFDPDKAFSKISNLYPVMRDVTMDEARIKAQRMAKAEAMKKQSATQDIGNMLSGAQTASEIDPTAGLLGQLTGQVAA
jgi:hypothetical protein